MRNLYKTKFIQVVTWMMGISALVLFVTIYAILPLLSDANYIYFMKTIVLDYTESYYYPELVSFIDDLYSDGKGDDITELTLNMFEGDPDLIRLEGETSHFIDVIVNDTRYVIYTEELTNIKPTLEMFFTEGFKSQFTQQESDWQVYNDLDNAIAYRGGSGYNYAIWKLND